MIIEAEDMGKVLHSGQVGVNDARLDDMLPFAAKDLPVEDAVERRGANFDGSEEGFAIDDIGNGGADIGERDAAGGHELLGVDGVAQRQLRAKAPSLDEQRKRKRRAEIDASNQRRGAERRLTAVEAGGGGLYAPMQRRVQQRAIEGGKFDSGRVKDGDHVSGGSALEILVAAGGSVEKQTAGGVGEKGVGLDFGIYRLGKDVTECQPKHVGAQIIEVVDGADVVGEGAFGVEMRLPPALVDAVNAAVEDAEGGQVEEGAFRGPGAEFALWSPAAAGKIFAAGGQIHAAADGPEDGFAEGVAAGGRAAEVGNQEPGLARFFLHRVGGERQVEDGDALNAKIGVVDGGVTARFDDDLVREELPLGAGEFAGGHTAVGDHVMVRAFFLDHLAGEEEWVGSGEDGAVPGGLNPEGPGDVLKAANFAVHVVGATGGFDMLMVGAAFEQQVAFGLEVAGIRVVGDLVGGKGENAVVDFDVFAQLVNLTVFFLMHRADADRIGALGRGGRWVLLRRRSGKQLAGN